MFLPEKAGATESGCANGGQREWLKKAGQRKRYLNIIIPVRKLNFMANKEKITYELPDEAVALYPAAPRDSSRLMAVSYPGPEIRHLRFRDIEGILKKDDLVVVNDSRVINARIIGKRSTGGKTEFLLVERKKKDLWMAMGRPASRLKEGEVIYPDGGAKGICLKEKKDNGFFILSIPEEALASARIPLPPYIISKRALSKSDADD